MRRAAPAACSSDERAESAAYGAPRAIPLLLLRRPHRLLHASADAGQTPKYNSDDDTALASACHMQQRRQGLQR